MGDEAECRFPQWLLIGTLTLGIIASTLLAERSGKLYAFVAMVIVSGGILYAIHRVCAPTVRVVLFVAVLFRLIAFTLPPGLSDDAYRYVWDGRLQHAGTNPYTVVPSEVEAGHHDDELYARLNSWSFYSVYPPLSQIVFYAGASFDANGWRTHYYLIKLIILLIECLGLLVLVRMVGPAIAILYAWNPVVVMEVAGQGHTEGLVAGLVLIAVFLVRRKRHVPASIALTAAGMVKLVPFLGLPFVWRRGKWMAITASVLTGIVLSFPYYAPGVASRVLQSLRLYVSYFEFNAGPYFAVKWALQAFTGQDFSKLIGPAFGWLFLAVLAVIYLADRRDRWPIEKALAVILSWFFLLSTTVHPWYLVPLLAVTVVEEKIRWHWYWMSLVSMGTYLLYVDGPYWLFVSLAWSTWLVFALAYHRDAVLQRVQRRRGAAKWDFIAPWILPTSNPAILDLGAGEGYVGLAASRAGADVTLADVVDMNRTALPFQMAKSDTLDFESGSFDYVILYFVLHHARDPEAVVREACRVARCGVVVVESVYDREGQRRLLRVLDKMANRLRSRGLMRGQEEYLHFRTQRGWLQLFRDLGLSIDGERSGGNWIHRTAAFLISR